MKTTTHRDRFRKKENNPEQKGVEFGKLWNKLLDMEARLDRIEKVGVLCQSLLESGEVDGLLLRKQQGELWDIQEVKGKPRSQQVTETKPIVESVEGGKDAEDVADEDVETTK